MTNRRHEGELGKEHTGYPFPYRQVLLPKPRAACPKPHAPCPHPTHHKLNETKTHTQSCNEAQFAPTSGSSSPTQDTKENNSNTKDTSAQSSLAATCKIQIDINTGALRHCDELLIVRLVWLLLAIKSVRHSSNHPMAAIRHPTSAIRHSPYAVWYQFSQ